MVCMVGAGILALGLAFGAPAALADTGDIIAPRDPAHRQVDRGWQAGTCKANRPKRRVVCSVATPDSSSNRPPGHPNWGFTQFIVKNEAPGETPVDELKTVRVDLPVGLSVNPGATSAARSRSSNRARETARVPGIRSRQKPGHRRPPPLGFAPPTAC